MAEPPAELGVELLAEIIKNLSLRPEGRQRKMTPWPLPDP